MIPFWGSYILRTMNTAMKSCITTRLIRVCLLPLTAFGLFLLPASGAPEQGASREEVIDMLGEPEGSVNGGGVEVLRYRLGIVELEDGFVMSSDLMTEEVFEHRRLAKEKKISEEKRRAEEARDCRVADGTAELKRVEADESFAKTSATDRLKYWQDFRRKYPEVDVSSQLRAAQSEGEGQEIRMAELEEEFRQGMRQPPIRTSSRKLRKYRRGRSAGAIAKRESQLMAELFPEESGN